MMIDAARLLLFPTLVAFAASSDLVTMTISNKVSLILAAGFLVLALAIGMDARTIGFHLLAGGAVLAIGFALFAFGWIGGGDAKLAAAIALWMGLEHIYAFVFWASVLGGVLTILLLMFRGMPLPPQLLGQEWIARLHDRRTGVPYGIALAAAALLIYPQTDWFNTAGF